MAQPPDILLTNYVMLELIHTRPRESRMIEAAQGLRFLVLDELHTYRGRQGTMSPCWSDGSGTALGPATASGVSEHRRLWPAAGPACGYLHPLGETDVVDLCERCGASLGAVISGMMRGGLLRLHHELRDQKDHGTLDRHSIREYLLELAGSILKASPGEKPRADHLSDLMKRCDSELEREWLRFVDERGLNLPTHAQYLIRECGTRVDFFYDLWAEKAAVFAEGPVHDDAARRERDRKVDGCLEDLGVMVGLGMGRNGGAF